MFNKSHFGMCMVTTGHYYHQNFSWEQRGAGARARGICPAPPLTPPMFSVPRDVGVIS